MDPVAATPLLPRLAGFQVRGALALLCLAAWGAAFGQETAASSPSASVFVVPPDANGHRTIVSRAEPPRPLQVLIYSGPGAPRGGVDHVIRVLTPFPQVRVSVAKPEDFAGRTLPVGDVVVFPGGSGSGQSKGLGETGLRNVREFVRQGGGYVGICAGAYLACASFDWGLAILNAGTVSSKWRRGQAMLELECTGDAVPVFGEVSGRFKVHYNNGPILKPWTRTDLPAYTTLAVFRTEVAEHGAPPGVQISAPAQAVATFGKGRVFVSSPHPENTPGLKFLIPRGLFWAAGGDSVPDETDKREGALPLKF